jgi:hypothetical protein
VFGVGLVGVVGGTGMVGGVGYGVVVSLLLQLKQMIIIKNGYRKFLVMYMKVLNLIFMLVCAHPILKCIVRCLKV